MNPYTRLFVVVALLISALIPSAAPLRAASADSNKQGSNKQNDDKQNDDKQNDSSTVKVHHKVRKDIANDGRARVIVQIRLPGRGHVPEGRLLHAAASLQRSDIAKIRGNVL